MVTINAALWSSSTIIDPSSLEYIQLRMNGKRNSLKHTPLASRTKYAARCRFGIDR